ncbi:Hypothetical protein CINCED_3A018526 [Cinara cedri]|uniref:Uncharacterized protein n=1 Tax=Cinara cedri TaxID=506608 RepID=A0A5E4MPT3_9HEMI|nr:Hypothetical protein CINCED_3A018526 [Cinara cedri]
MARKYKIRVTTVVVIAILCPTALGRIAEKKESDTKWETAIKQDEFEGITLPENTDVPTVTQMTPAIVKIGQRYGVPYWQSLGKKKNKPDKNDGVTDHMMIMSGGTLMSLGVFAMIVMAGKALLLALGAVLLTCLSSGWTGGGGGGGGGYSKSSESASTVYEVIAKPQISHGHSYSSEVHHEPYSPTSSLQGYYSAGYYGNRRRRRRRRRR